MGVDSRKKRTGLNNHVKCLLYLDINIFYTTIYSKKCFTVAQHTHTHTHTHIHTPLNQTLLQLNKHHIVEPITGLSPQEVHL